MYETVIKIFLKKGNNKKIINYFAGIKFCNIFILFFIFALLSCNKGNDTNISNPVTTQTALTNNVIKDKKDVLIRELSADPVMLNPVLTGDTYSSYVEGLIFNSLIDIDGSPQSNIIPSLAEKWEISPDREIIIFHLRKGIKWQDGEPFTADDVKFTFDIARSKNIPSIGLKSELEPLKSVEVIDPYTIRFSLLYPYGPALTSFGTTSIIPKHLLDDKALMEETKANHKIEHVTFLTTAFNRKPVGTGPYRFKEWKTDQYITLDRNENYWDKSSFPSIKKVRFKILSSRTAAFNVLRKGNLDVFRARTIQYLNFIRMPVLKKKFRPLKFYAPVYYYIAWNLRGSNPFFSDKNVRLAMTKSLDRDAFIKKVQFGMGHIITGPFYFKSWAYNSNIEPIKYNLEEARMLLRKAGWIDTDNDGILDRNGVKFEFELMIPTSAPLFAQLASIFQANLKKISIEMNITQYEWSVYLNRKRKGEFNALIGGWSLGIDPDPYSIWHSSQIKNGNNNIGFKNEEVDRLLVAARRMFERSERQRIYWKIHEILHDEQPYTFVFTSMETYILSRRIKNVTVSPFGLYSFYPGQLKWKLEELAK